MLIGLAHLLGPRDELRLSADQLAVIQVILDAMRAEAIEVGSRLINAEKAVGIAFRAGGLGGTGLRWLIKDATALRAELRFIDLSRHLSTPQNAGPDHDANVNSAPRAMGFSFAQPRSLERASLLPGRPLPKRLRDGARSKGRQSARPPLPVAPCPKVHRPSG